MLGTHGCTQLGKREDAFGLFTEVTAAAKSLQSCPTLCDPRDGSPPGSPVPGILQARTLEWAAISFSNRGDYVHGYIWWHTGGVKETLVLFLCL